MASPAWPQTVAAAVQTALQGRNILYFADSEQFLNSEEVYFTAAAQAVQSAAVARPTSTNDVSELLKVLRQHLPKNVPIAVRGAGHATYGGMAKAASGVTIDIRGLRGVDIHPDENRVRIGAGEHWSSVYSTLEAHQPRLTTVGGRMPTVGVAGFLLGGGISAFSSRFGFGADVVLAWEIVTASGDIVLASRDDDATSDLWDVLRGGSTNFGIVTAIEMACFPHPDTFRGTNVFYLPIARHATLKALVNMAKDPSPQEGDPINHSIWSISHFMGMKFINAMLTTTGSPEQVDMRDWLRVWGRVPLTGNLKTRSHGDFITEYGKLVPSNGSRTLDKTITVKLDYNLLNNLVDLWYAHNDAIGRRVTGLMNSLVFQALSVGMLEISCQAAPSRPSSITSQGLDPREGPLIVVEICMTWKKAEDDEFMERAIADFLKDCVGLAERRGLGHRFIFPNYAWPIDDVMKGYGEQRLLLLRNAAQRWDPEGFLQTQFTGGFKLGM